MSGMLCLTCHSWEHARPHMERCSCQGGVATGDYTLWGVGQGRTSVGLPVEAHSNMGSAWAARKACWCLSSLFVGGIMSPRPALPTL